MSYHTERPARTQPGSDSWITRRQADLLPRKAADSVGVDPEAIARFLKAVTSSGCELHSFMIYRAGGVIAEGWWWPYRADRLHFTHSATKSFTATGVGLAISEGYFALDDKVVDFFPDKVPVSANQNLRAMTVEHLLTQTTGLASGASGSIWRNIETSWIDEFFKIPADHEPGTTFLYSSHNSFMLSAIISRTTGQNLYSYLLPRFFEPLGMTDVRWDVGPENINPGGNGLSCTTADLLKLGLIHLKEGRWQSDQLIDRNWIKTATQDHTGHDYGYHWWISPDRQSYYAAGKFGQHTFVFPRHDAVLAVTAAVPSLERTLRSLVWRHFPSGFEPGAGSSTHPAASGQEIAELTVLEPIDRHDSQVAATVSGQTYRMQPNNDGLREISFAFGPTTCLCAMTDERGEHEVTVGLNQWAEGWTTVSGASLHHGYEPDRMRVVAGGTWRNNNTFEMTWQFVETPFRDTVTVQFSGTMVTVDRRVNVNSSETSRPTLTGTVATPR